MDDYSVIVVVVVLEILFPRKKLEFTQEEGSFHCHTKLLSVWWRVVLYLHTYATSSDSFRSYEVAFI